MKGTVKFFNAAKGFGFIKAEDGKECFVHISGIEDGVELNEDDSVSFEPQQDNRGIKAINVKIDSGDSLSKETSKTHTDEEEEK